MKLYLTIFYMRIKLVLDVVLAGSTRAFIVSPTLFFPSCCHVVRVATGGGGDMDPDEEEAMMQAAGGAGVAGMPEAAAAAAKGVSPKYKKAPDAPKRFKSAFIIFSAEKHKEIKEEFAKQGRSEKVRVCYVSFVHRRAAVVPFLCCDCGSFPFLTVRGRNLIIESNDSHFVYIALVLNKHRPPTLPSSFPRRGVNWIQMKRRSGKRRHAKTRLDTKWKRPCTRARGRSRPIVAHPKT
jgi:hypothetical protein